MRANSLLLGIDLGTSAVKVVATTAGGETVGEAAVPYPLMMPGPDFVEQDPAVVYAATLTAIRQVMAAVQSGGRGGIAAIGLSCAMHGVLPVDADGTPIGGLITWMDGRSSPIARRWRADGTAAELYASTGAPVHPMLPSCKLRWLNEHMPDLMRRAARFVSMKELLVWRWTGEWLVDWGLASATGLFDVHARDWNAQALGCSGIDSAQLSMACAPSTSRSLSGAVAAEMGFDSLPQLVMGSSDGALANLGVGAIGRGERALTLGTSGAVRVVVGAPVLDEAARTFCYCFDDNAFIAGGSTSSAGAVLAKIFAMLLPDVHAARRLAEATALAAASPIGANGVTVLPFFSGERAPYWNGDLRGAFFGLSLTQSRADLLRAALESVVFAVYSVEQILRVRVGKPPCIRLAGGLAHDPFVRQMVADVFTVPAVLAEQSEASAFGAAMLAGIATGAVEGLTTVAQRLQPAHVHQPDAAAADGYRAAFARYTDAVTAMLPLYGGTDSRPRA